MNSEGYLEKVRPDDGRLESGWVFITVLLILLLGGFGISQHQTVPASLPGHLLLGVSDKATLTTLRNAGDEILFMAEEGAELPTVKSLIADGVPPFAEQPGDVNTHQWQLMEGRCYLGVPKDSSSQMQFLLTVEGGVAVYWQAQNSEHDHAHESDPSHSTHQQPDGAVSICTPDDHWQVLSNA